VSDVPVGRYRIATRSSGAGPWCASGSALTQPSLASRVAWASLARQRQAFDHDDGWTSVRMPDRKLVLHGAFEPIL
jgi:hypothetical protein